jgi:hypothetical protein
MDHISLAHNIGRLTAQDFFAPTNGRGVSSIENDSVWAVVSGFITGLLVRVF